MSDRDERILLCSIGAFNYAEVDYRLGEGAWTTRFAPVALARTRSMAGARCLVLVTPEARSKWLDEFSAEMRDAALDIEALDVPIGRSEVEILDIFTRIAAAVPEGAHVTLEVTYALRHLPFVYLASLAYLVGQRGVLVDGIFYGAFEVPNEDGSRPILDITSLFELLRWYQALEEFRSSGSATALSRQFRGERQRLRGLGWTDTGLRNTAGHVEKLSLNLTSVLPLEAGLVARHLVDETRSLDDKAVPEVLRLSVAGLRELAQKFAVDRAVKKESLGLDEAELDRQIRLARWYAERRDAPRALLVLREWLVNVAVMARGASDAWLDFAKVRRPAEWFFGSLAHRAELGVANERERRIARVWKEIADARNQFAHAGMRKPAVDPKFDLGRQIDACIAGRADLLELLAAPPASRRLLLSGLGMSPGVLATALDLARPDAAIVVTSAAAEAQIEEAFGRAGRRGAERIVLRLEDAHTDFDAAARFEKDRRLLDVLAAASELVVNWTGGTSAMQYVVAALAARAARMGLPVRRFLLIDRRTPQEQRAEPWLRGELVWLDADVEDES